MMIFNLIFRLLNMDWVTFLLQKSKSWHQQVTLLKQTFRHTVMYSSEKFLSLGTKWSCIASFAWVISPFLTISSMLWLMCDREIPLKFKRRILWHTIRPTMLYGTECYIDWSCNWPHLVRKALVIVVYGWCDT